MFDPLGTVMQDYRERYPGKEVRLVWCSDLVDRAGSDGLCRSPGRGNLDGTHTVFLDPSLSVARAAHVLIHELAHTVVPTECCDAHGPEFNAVVDSLTHEFTSTVDDWGIPHFVDGHGLDYDEEDESWGVALKASPRPCGTMRCP